MLKKIPSCKRFTGYKPCFPDHNCFLDGCRDCIPTGVKILIINLDAMGDMSKEMKTGAFSTSLNEVKRVFRDWWPGSSDEEWGEVENFDQAVALGIRNGMEGLKSFGGSDTVMEMELAVKEMGTMEQSLRVMMLQTTYAKAVHEHENKKRRWLIRETKKGRDFDEASDWYFENEYERLWPKVKTEFEERWGASVQGQAQGGGGDPGIDSLIDEILRNSQ